MTRRLSPQPPARRPTVTNGTFTGSHTLTLQRLGRRGGEGERPRPATSSPTTRWISDGPAARHRGDVHHLRRTFVITDKGMQDGMTINGKSFPTQGTGLDPGSGRITITIDATGAITVVDPTTKVPQADPPG